MKAFRIQPGDKQILEALAGFLTISHMEGSSGQHLANVVQDDRTFLLGATDGEKLIGYALAYRFPSLYGPEYLAYMYDVEVLPEYRRKGVGKLLMQTLLAELKAAGVNEMWLGTATDNHQARALFRATGGVCSDETFFDITYDLS